MHVVASVPTKVIFHEFDAATRRDTLMSFTVVASIFLGAVVGERVVHLQPDARWCFLPVPPLITVILIVYNCVLGPYSQIKEALLQQQLQALVDADVESVVANGNELGTLGESKTPVLPHSL